MSFAVDADAYQRFMGRFSEPLAVETIALAPPARGERVLDVGCGPGALTDRLAAAAGEDAVAAVDPSVSFVTAVRRRLPAAHVSQAYAEDLPFADDTFTASYAQLVVHFMRDPVQGLQEMRRVTVPDGRVVACVWDHEGGTGPLAAFWRAVHDVDPDAPDESGLAGTREGHLAALAVAAGLADVEPVTLTVSVSFATFEEWWEPFTLGVGPAGAYVAGLDGAGVRAVRDACRTRLPAPPFTLDARAWGVVGRA